MARMRAAEGARIWFVEQPFVEDVSEPVLRREQHGDVTRVWLAVPPVPHESGRPDCPEFHSPVAADYGDLLADLLAVEGRPSPDVWVYTPMAFDLAQRLDPGRLVYDVMDDLSAFLDAPEGLALRQRRLLDEADVVFTGGRSLHRFASSQRHHNVHCFPSGVQTAHYAKARQLRRESSRDTLVAGYVGVIDERLDLALLAGLARELSDWTIQMVGPVAKIDPASLPRANNLHYLGMKKYEELPEVMAGFDVALMPFALNEATRSISPTKTLEYLAAGLPVVSTRVPDVVTDFGQVVRLADDAPAFAAACRKAVARGSSHLDSSARRILARHEWDAITARMVELLDEGSGVNLGGGRARRLTAANEALA